MPEEKEEKSTTHFGCTFDASGINRRNLMIATGVGMTSIGGFSQTSAAQNTSGGDEIWSFETDSQIRASPTVVDGTVYVGSDNLYGIDAATGRQEWVFETDGLIRSSPTVVNETVYVGSLGGSLCAVDAETGDQIWAFDTGDFINSSPTVADGTVYVGSRDTFIDLYAVDAETGEQEWRFEAHGEIWSSPTVVDGTVYVGSDDLNLYAVDSETGTEEWAFETNGRIRSSPTVVDGTVYVGSGDNNLYALDAETGTEEWTLETDHRIESSPTIVDETVFFLSFDDYLYAVDTETGTEEWGLSFRFGGGPSSPTVADETVYVGSNDNNLYAVDVETGTKEWAFETGDSIYSSPTVVNGVVYVGSNDNKLYALDAGVEGSSEGSRVNLGTLGHHQLDSSESADEPINETGSITGFVTDSEDTSIADATVKIIDDGDIIAETTTDANGEYELTDVDTGTFELEATKVEFEKDTTEIIIQDDTTHNESLELVSKEENETGSISGFVTDSEETSIADATIKVTEDDVSIAETNTNENGEYELSDVPTGTFELEAEKSGYETATTEITVEADTTQNESLELTIVEELEESREQKLEIAEHLKTISVSDIDEKSEVEALFNEYESLLVDDEVETDQAEEAVERLIMAEEVVARSLEVTGQGAPRDAEADDYNMAAQTYASLFQGIVEWKFGIKEIKESLAGLTRYEQIISSALDYLTDAVEDLIVEQTVGFMEDEVDVIGGESMELAEEVIAAYELADDVTSGDIRSIAEELVDPVAERFGTSGQQNLEENGSSRLLAESSPGYREQTELSIENTTSEVWADGDTYQNSLDGARINRNNGLRRINQNAENLENSLTQEHDGLSDLIDFVLDLKRAGLSDTWSVLQELAQFIWDRLPIVRAGFNTGQGIVLIESVVDESYDSVDSIVGRESV